MKRVHLTITIALLSGCALTPLTERAPSLAVPAQCSPQCTMSCVPSSDRWPQWTGDPQLAETWDRIDSELLAPLRVLVDSCDAHRVACVECLRRLEQVGVVCGVDDACP